MLARTLLFGVLPLLVTACGVTGNFRNDPGYADFGRVSAAEREVGISLGPLPLRIARWVIDEDEAEIGPLLEELRAVRVYTYEVVGDEQQVADSIEEIRADLLADGWLSLIRVNEGGEATSVLLRPGRGGNRGLAVLVHEPSEVVLVNLIGNVRLDLFNEYMTELDVEAPAIEIDAESLQAHAVQSP
jgi:hypothetical protein